VVDSLAAEIRASSDKHGDGAASLAQFILQKKSDVIRCGILPQSGDTADENVAVMTMDRVLSSTHHITPAVHLRWFLARCQASMSLHLFTRQFKLRA
jgi:hypothetical protein